MIDVLAFKRMGIIISDIGERLMQYKKSVLLFIENQSSNDIIDYTLFLVFGRRREIRCRAPCRSLRPRSV